MKKSFKTIIALSLIALTSFSAFAKPKFRTVEQIKKSGNGIMQKSSFKDILKMVKQDDREKDHDSSDIIPNGTKDQDT